MKSSMIRIPSRRNSDGNYITIKIFKVKILLLITISILFWSLFHLNWPNLIYFGLKGQKRWLQCRLKDLKSKKKIKKVNLYWKSIFILKKSIYIKKNIDQIWLLLMYFQSLSINFELFDWIRKQYNIFFAIIQIWGKRSDQKSHLKGDLNPISNKC